MGPRRVSSPAPCGVLTQGTPRGSPRSLCHSCLPLPYRSIRHNPTHRPPPPRCFQRPVALGDHFSPGFQGETFLAGPVHMSHYFLVPIPSLWGVVCLLSFASCPRTLLTWATLPRLGGTCISQFVPFPSLPESAGACTRDTPHSGMSASPLLLPKGRDFALCPLVPHCTPCSGVWTHTHCSRKALNLQRGRGHSSGPALWLRPPGPHRVVSAHAGSLHDKKQAAAPSDGSGELPAGMVAPVSG